MSYYTPGGKKCRVSLRIVVCICVLLWCYQFSNLIIKMMEAGNNDRHDDRVDEHEEDSIEETVNDNSNSNWHCYLMPWNGLVEI